MKSLTKSKYLSGLQCVKKLWLDSYDPDKAPPLTEQQEYIMGQGQEVGELARSYFKDSVLIDYSSYKNMLSDTLKVLNTNPSAIFEATFKYHNTLVRVDVLRNNFDGTWDLIEVKSTSTVKEEHIPDLAIQKYVLINSGIKVAKCFLMYLNNKCVYPDLSDLFELEDLTREIEQELSVVESNLEYFNKILQIKNEPDILIGDHCKKPHECAFKDYCWSEVGDRSIYDVPRLSTDKKDKLIADNIFLIDAIPEDFELTSKQSEYIRFKLNYIEEIDTFGISNKLSELEYPICFLDFETSNFAIPRYKGASPYTQVPFQYSCHIMNKDGKIEHNEFLHVENTDPRGDFIKSLLNIIGDNGSIVAYNAPFEERILKSLIPHFPHYSEKIESLIQRIWDQLYIFRNHYKHSGFNNSNSLKNVLPILVTKLKYDDLSISSGDQAVLSWIKLIETDDDNKRAVIIKNLKEYCKMDTLAMVEIHKLLDTMISSQL